MKIVKIIILSSLVTILSCSVGISGKSDQNEGFTSNGSNSNVKTGFLRITDTANANLSLYLVTTGTYASIYYYAPRQEVYRLSTTTGEYYTGDSVPYFTSSDGSCTGTSYTYDSNNIAAPFVGQRVIKSNNRFFKIVSLEASATVSDRLSGSGCVTNAPTTQERYKMEEITGTMPDFTGKTLQIEIPSDYEE